MHVTLVVPTLNRYDRLQVMLGTVAQQTVMPDRILVIDNGRRLTRNLVGQDWLQRLGVHVLTPPSNKGVAGSCNEALRQAQEWWLHSNDDVEWEPDLLERLKTAASTGPWASIEDHMFYAPSAEVGSTFSVFLMHAQSALDLVGWWDENFWPIYFEDNDYGLRMNQAGIKRHHIPDCRYKHHTSSTVAAWTPQQQEAQHQNFRNLKAYFTTKWGGPPDHETFTTPWNGGPPTEPDKSMWPMLGRPAPTQQAPQSAAKPQGA